MTSRFTWMFVLGALALAPCVSQGQVNSNEEMSVHKVISSDGTPIAYHKSGRGPTLVMVHGTTADHKSWQVVSPLLEAHFTVCAVDRRGRGASGDGSVYTFEREVEDIVAVIESFDEPVFILGHSFGGLCVLEAALRTDNVARMLLYEPALPTDLPIVEPGVMAEIERLHGEGRLEDAMVHFLRKVAKFPDEDIALYRQKPIWKERLQLIPTISREMNVEHSYQFDPTRFVDFQTHTTLILGGDSPRMYSDAIQLLSSALPNNRVEILPDQQHIAHHVAPELFAETLLRCLGTE
jgi:pimeloyl-ACP methyl ester carboxylesterase